MGSKSDKDAHKLSEEELKNLLNRIAARDHKASVEFYKHFRHEVAVIVKSLVFDDEYTQDTIINTVLYEGMQSATRYRGEGDFSAYLGGIARRQCKNHIRKKYQGISTVVDETLINAIPDDAPTAEMQLIQKQEYSKLRDCLKRLTDKHRDVVLGTYFGELSEAECADHLAIAPGTVKSRLSAAKKKLEDCLTQKRKGTCND